MASDPEQTPRRLQREMVRAERERRAAEQTAVRVPRGPVRHVPAYETPDRRGSAAGLSLMLAVLSLLLLAVIGVLVTRQRYLRPQTVAHTQPVPGWTPPASEVQDDTPVPATPGTPTPAAPPAPATTAPAVPVFSVPSAPAPPTDPSASVTVPAVPTDPPAPTDIAPATATPATGDPSSGTATPNDGFGTAPATPAPSSGLPDPATPDAPPSSPSQGIGP